MLNFRKTCEYPRYSNCDIDFTMMFDLSKMSFYRYSNESDIYFIPLEYQSSVCKLTETLNPFLREATSLCPQLPLCKIKSDRLLFDLYDPNLTDFTVLLYEPVTATRKQSKYPYQINFSDTKKMPAEICAFGMIYFTKENVIGKAEIICWHKRKCYVIHLGTKKNVGLHILRIETSNEFGQKVSLYNSKQDETNLFNER